MEKKNIEIQDEINNLYFERFKNYSNNLGLSVPLIPRISEKYFENRTVIIGQETNTWYRNGNHDGLKNIFLANQDNIEKVCLNDRYDKFIKNSVSKYSGKFWVFIKLLYEEQIIKNEFIENNNLSHLWLNLFLVEACKDKNDKNGRPTSNSKLAEQVNNLQGNLIREILNILKPKLIISMTGYKLDYILLNNVLSNKSIIKSVDSKKILNKEMLGEIIITDKEDILYNTKIIRSYHPTYFMGKINTNKNLRKKLQKMNIISSVANYYQKVFIDKLKQIKEDNV